MTNPNTITIASRPIGQDHPPYVIAELSGNHNGSLERALAMVDAAAATGADAIKIQTYTPDTITLRSDRPEYRVSGGPWNGRTLHDLYAEAHTPYAWHKPLFDRAASRGVTLFSSPFDATAVGLLSSLGAPAYKVASFEIVDLDLLARIAREGRPVIVSTGMADLGEITDAVRTLRAHGAEQIALLHCTSSYPAPIAAAHLRTIPHLAAAYDVVAGLSDHTPGTACAVAAVALGACVIEKHFTLDRSEGGPDAAFSMEPVEFTALVRDCRAAWDALGRVGYGVEEAEASSVVFRRSLIVAADVAKGELLTRENVRSLRPGYGLPPKHLPEILGRRARRDLERGQPLAWCDLD